MPLAVVLRLIKAANNVSSREEKAMKAAQSKHK